jgi:hypothetical protein
MPLTRLDNLLSSKTGKYIYVSPDDFNASDSLDNRGNSQLRPFVTIQRAFLEVGRYSYVPGIDNDRFDQFTIMLAPGTHYVDNRPGDADTANIPVFNYDIASDTWNDPSIFDLGNENNILYRFNGIDGGTTIPRGTSLVGTDLRRTQVRALYLPDPADKDVPRTSLFNVTGGCYFWQFTILDSNPVNGPLNGLVYTQPGSTQKSTPLFSHHKMTNFVYADKADLSSLYRKIAKCFSGYQESIDDVYTAESGRIKDTWVSSTAYTTNESVVFGGEAYKALSGSTNKRPDLEDTFWERLSTISRELDYRIQENRIVGPLADTIQLDEIVVTEPSAGVLDVTVRTKINHGYFPGQYVSVVNIGLNVNLEGVFAVYSISPTNPKEFKYRVATSANAVGLIPGASVTPASSATAQAEIDSVESASPYVFNVSIRSTWGICGIWADGRKATGFKSMVIAQYTGVSLQRDDRAFIRYDEFSNTWNQAPLTDAFATTPYHIKGDAFWKDDWRNFHVRASDDSFIQNVSIFAVGFADHFLLESGGDMSITNSNSNFGNTSMHSKGFKGFAFNQDKGGYITDIIPPKTLDDSAQPIKTNYYPLDVQLSKPSTNSNRLYLTGDKANNFLSRPAASINGYRIGARTYINDNKSEKIYVNTTADQTSGETGSTTKSAVIYPQGFKIWESALDTLSPANLGVGDFNEDGTPNTAADTLSFNLRQDAANLIDSNKTFIQSEAFGYILEKYPYLQTISYVNPNITFESGRYRDARNLIQANRQEIIDYAYTQMLASFPGFTPPSEDKCRRDLGLIIDAVSNDLYDGGNSHIIAATKTYFDVDGAAITNGLVGEITQSIYAFNRARDWAKKAISNLLGNTSLVPVISLTASGTTVTATTSTAHGLAVGDQINVTNAALSSTHYEIYKGYVLATGFTATQFQYTAAVAPSESPATGPFIVSTIIIDPANSEDGATRYKDGARLILANKTEIIDRASAQISVDFPDFVYPGDPATADSYRFDDAYRLIQQNKQEIADRAAAEIAVQFPDFVYPNGVTTEAKSRFLDAYRLIQQNRTDIITTAFAATGGSIPGDTNGDKCKRDIGIFIDAVSLDIAQGGGNRYSRKFVQRYFNTAGTAWISNGLDGEQVASNLAFNSAAVEMKKAITNQLAVKDLTITAGAATYGGSGGNIANTNAGSCADIQSAIDSLTLVITTRITAGNATGLPAETNNNNNKYDDSANLIVANKSEIVDRAVGEIAIEYPDFVFPGDSTTEAASRFKDSYRLIQKNRTVIIDNAYLEIAIQYPAFVINTANETKCKRDIGLFIDAISLDISRGGGNKYTRKFVKTYFNDAGVPITTGLGGEELQSIAAFNAAVAMMKRAVTNTLSTYTKSDGSAFIGTLYTDTTITADPATNSNVSTSSCANVRTAIDTLSAIVNNTLFAKNTLGVFTATLSGLPVETSGLKPAGEAKCRRDVGMLIDAVVKDLRAGSNTKTKVVASSYFTNAGAPLSNGLVGETAQSIVAFNKARDVMKLALTNQLYTKDLTITADPATGSNTSTASCSGAQTYVDNLISIVTTAISNGNLSGLPADVIGVPGPGELQCRRDIGIFIDAVSLDISNGGGNVYSRKFVQRYFDAAGTSWIAAGLQGEEQQSIVAFNMARDMMNKAITNQLFTFDSTISAGPATAGGSGGNIVVPTSGNAAACADVQSAITNLTTLITARLTAGNATGLPAETVGTNSAGKTKCKRDIGIIVDSIQQDLFWGGNEFVVAATREYFSGLSTLLANGLAGEISESVVAFNAARDQLKKAVTNQLFNKDLILLNGDAYFNDGLGIQADITVINGITTYTQPTSGNPNSCVDVQNSIETLTSIITSTLIAGNLNSLPASNNGKWDCANVRDTVDTLFAIFTTAIGTGTILTLPPINLGQWSTVSEASKCRRDIGYIVEAITSDLRLGGNENTVNAAEAYFTGTGQQTLSGTLASNGIITGLTSTANLLTGMAVTKSTGVGAFGVNPTILAINGPTSITVTQTSGTVTAGAISFIANQLDYIEKERVETLDAYDYLRNIAISSMRNHNTYLSGSATGNSAVVNVPSTNGLVIGMQVRSVTTIPTNTGSQNAITTNYNDELEEVVNGRVVPKATNYTAAIPSNAYIMKIGDGSNGLLANQIQLGTKGSKFDSGVLVTADSSLGTNTPVNLFFQLQEGVWANAIKPSVDLSVLQDYGYTATYGECSSVVENINTFYTTFSTVINNGIGSVAKKVSTLATGTFAQRATLFTLTDTSANALPTNPHHLETGTAVRLVPRAKAGKTVDKKLIRLPKGFDTNTIYYVIAPGRKTDPYDYSNTTRFDGTTAGSYQNLMLASSSENAATGIYIYSSETQSVDENVVIDVYQYVLDVKYDLNQYITRRGDGTTLVTEEPHVFDIPNSSWNVNDNQKYQAIFFKPIGAGALPTGISSAREYYARYINKPNLTTNSQFEVYETLTQAIAGATPVTFPAFTGSFYTFSSKKRSPLRFAPEAGASLSYDETKLFVNDKTIFSIGDYVRVADEFFFVTGISVTGADHLVVTRSALGTFPINHSVGATVNKWSYLPTASTTTLTETVDLVETIFDFTSTSLFLVGNFVKLTNSVNALTEVIKITSIEGNQVIATRAQLGTVVQQQNGTVTATKLDLSVSSPAVTTTLSESYPKLLTAAESGNYAGGTWYLGTDSSRPNTILERMRREDFSTKDKTPDTWFERLEDPRTKEDRVYRLRYVIPNYLKAVRDPLNGFVIKARNDETRRLLPQKILIKPTGSGSNIAELSIPNQGAAVAGKSANREYLGYTSTEHGPTYTSIYDPYNPATLSNIDLTQKYRVRITTDSKITFYVQSARRVTVSEAEYIELTVFNIGIEEQGYKEKLFTTVKIDVPEGGTGAFVASTVNLSDSDTSNVITWSGNCKGKARVHAYFNYENQNYMILKDITLTSKLEYNPTTDDGGSYGSSGSSGGVTTFSQGSVTARLAGPPDGGRSNIDNYLYAIEGSNAYTLTPGDTFQAENGNYTIASVTDTEDFNDTFYIFDIDTIRRRIAGQQDGIYYLSCLRGNISPFPTGSGVGDNFRDYKFSQPVSKLYPEFYKNDPEWYKQLNSAAVDPPATISAADNYVHGLVTVNDSKASVTKEGVLDLINDKGSKQYTFTGASEIKAQPGGASAGSEARRIPICGNSPYPTEKRLYVELRRPSIARSGNHTFEYLGFGPGNYSTGFPARQEVVLTDIQDFYAQAKRENGGIVFYTGLNSNGDLYIGNRKINAITGEETFLESAALVESSDEGDSIGNFVTTFDGPVTFNDIVSFLAPLQKGPNQWTSPIYMDVGTIVPTTGFNAPPALQIKSNIATDDDATLRINPITTRPTGDIIITDNRLQVAVVDFNTRGLQDYSIRTATSNVTPDQLNTFGAISGGTTTQVIGFGAKYPIRTGDMLLKGEQVGLTGSVAWVYANSFEGVPDNFRYQIQGFGAGNNKVRIKWASIPSASTNYTNTQVGIKSANYQIKITGTFQNSANLSLTSKILGAWSILGSTFGDTNDFVDISLNTYVDVGNYDVSSATEPTIQISISNVAWKEVGIIGAESIRTKTDDIGDYRVGINTVARTAHTAYKSGFIESGATDPRANLDIVGTTFISGKTLATSPNNYIANATLGARTFNNQDNALLVGGDSVAPNDYSVFRLSTTNSGRVGINTTNAQLNGSANNSWYAVAFAVIGDVAFSGNLRVQTDLAVNGGDITTSLTTEDFNIFNQTTYTGSVTNNNGVYVTTGLNIANFAAAINIGTARTDDQFINIANVSDHVNVRIANNPANTGAAVSNISKVNIGGAFANNESNSFVSFDSKLTRVGGDLALSYLRGAGSTVRITVPSGAILEAFNDATTLTLAGNASTISFGGQGGTTKIRNSLIVDASLVSNGNFTMNGGLSSFDFTGARAQMGTQALALTGTSTPPLDKTIDLVTIVNDIPGVTNYYVNQIDTAGSGNWGGISYQQVIANIGTSPNISGTLGANGVITGILSTSNLAPGMSLVKVSGTGVFGSSPTIQTINSATSITITQGAGSTLGSIVFFGTGAEPNSLPALTGKQFYLPLETSPNYNEGDYLLIDTQVVIGQSQHPEIVRIPTGGLVRTGLYPYYIIVERQPLGTFAPTRSDHPDNPTYRTKVRKINVAFDATWTTNNLTATTGSSNISLAEFGGTLGVGDYVIQQRRPPFNGTASTGTDTLSSVVSNAYTLEIGQIVYSQTEGIIIPDGTTITAVGNGTITLSNNVTGNGSGIFNIDVGEIIKIETSLTSTTRKLTINNGANPALTTFEVNTVNGDTSIGNPNITNSGNLTVYGNITLAGGCGDGSTTTDRKLTFRNSLFDTVVINTCNGNVEFGSPNAEIFVLGGFFGSTKAAHTTTDPVYAYNTAPEVRQGTGPLTTIAATVTAGDLHTGGTTQPTWDIPVNSILGFEQGDYVLIVDSSLTTNPASITKGEIVRITGTPFTNSGGSFLPTLYNSTYPASSYPTGGRGQETTLPQDWASGDILVKIIKDDRTTTLGVAVPATGRTVVELPNTNTNKIRIKLLNGDLISPKLDDQYVIRIGSEFFLPDSKSGAVDSVYGVRTPKSYRDPATISTIYPSGKLVPFYGGGELTIHDNLNIVSGNMRMFGSDGETVILSIGNDDGHSGDPSQLDPDLAKFNKTLPAGTSGFYLKGPANIHGDFKVVKDSCRENGVCDKVLQFEVLNETGSTYVGDKLYVRGQVKVQADPSTPILHIDNLGAAGTALTGPRDFIMYQDGSVDAFGIKQYFTANGGRRWTYLPFSLTGNGQTQGNPLQPNNNYLINPPTTGNMIVYLPQTALTGDIIRFIDLTGNLQYNSSLIIRALKINSVATGIQGDFVGTKANQGSSAPLTTAWDSGEMIVQTRNASFGLLFVGDTDATGDPNGLEIPSNLRGWFLVEL